MRALLSIIAGMLVADAVKAGIVSLTSGAASQLSTWTNVVVAFAGTCFVTRVVVDNLLYYTESDIRTQRPLYGRRVLLISFDLMSYAACYAIVARMTLSGDAKLLTTGAIRWMVTYATFVELSHAIWCAIALFGMKNDNEFDRKSRNEWLKDWLIVSSASFAAGTILTWMAWTHLRPGFAPVTCWLAISTFVIGMASTGAYLFIMRRHYMRQRTT
jgi:multisubunit Na+/H+ antiporter MnhC subunit